MGAESIESYPSRGACEAAASSGITSMCWGTDRLCVVLEFAHDNGKFGDGVAYVTHLIVEHAIAFGAGGLTIRVIRALPAIHSHRRSDHQRWS